MFRTIGILVAGVVLGVALTFGVGLYLWNDPFQYEAYPLAQDEDLGIERIEIEGYWGTPAYWEDYPGNLGVSSMAKTYMRLYVRDDIDLDLETSHSICTWPNVAFPGIYERTYIQVEIWRIKEKPWNLPEEDERYAYEFVEACAWEEDDGR